ncbi:Serine/threonine-protein phosphatase CPPED1 [Dissostichus eleginoides]|uniref:Serine/threonine-protein phosphatase CPPED1 n=1 Tax=Dissostichus eleginoides TaxID=100907 RepID=A0AAD9F0P5_DISEL|nr:Serine/threonine-protein phosphatase CPPED1 [Dissostichus eleginoides]
MADSEDIFLRAKHRTFSGLTEGGGPPAGADEGLEGGRLRAVEAVNQLRPRPRFMVLCGDLVHAMPEATEEKFPQTNNTPASTSDAANYPFNVGGHERNSKLRSDSFHRSHERLHGSWYITHAHHSRKLRVDRFCTQSLFVSIKEIRGGVCGKVRGAAGTTHCRVNVRRKSHEPSSHADCLCMTIREKHEVLPGLQEWTRRERRNTPFREGQERDLKKALKGTDPSIPLVFVSGNHDLGNTPTPRTHEQFCSAWGNDYFSFWVGGVLCLVLNSQLFHDASACPQLKEAQETWLEEQLSRASSSAEPKPKHVLVFQHIPLYLKTPDEEDDYFNLKREVRQSLLERFKRAGVKAVFSGHYHRNAGGLHDGLDMVVSSAIGCQLGDDAHGLRVVLVTDEAIVHRYVSLEQLSVGGADRDLQELLQG